MNQPSLVASDKLNGLIAATYTAYGPDGSVNLEHVSAYANHLKGIGVQGVFVNGTTGEGPSLTLHERIQLAEEWVKTKSPGFRVLIHVGHDSLLTAQELARHAETVGADGVGAMTPVFFKPTTIRDLILINKATAKAASSLPFYYYHVPSMTGVHLSMIQFLKAAEGEIPNLAGIKFTDENLMDLRLCLEFQDGKYDVLHGRDEILLSGLTLGIRSAIGSTYNYMAPLYLELMSAFQSGNLDLANTLQLKAMQIIQVLIKYGGGIRAGKSFMRLIGIELGPPRLPLEGLDYESEAQLKEELTQLDFLDYTTLR